MNIYLLPNYIGMYWLTQEGERKKYSSKSTVYCCLGTKCVLKFNKQRHPKELENCSYCHEIYIYEILLHIWHTKMF